MSKGQRHLLLVFLLTASGIPQESSATSPGPYVGVQFGLANVHQGSYIAAHLNHLIQKAIPDASTDYMDALYNNTGYAGRLFVGYQFNSYFAIETGYTQFEKLNINTTAGINIDIKKINFTFPANVSTHAAVTTDAFDLVGKGILPVTKRFSLYGKLGLAYLRVNGDVSAAAKVPELIDIYIAANPSLHIIYPTFSLGLNYDMTRRLSMDCSLTRIQQYSSHAFPSIDFLSIGVLYHFE